MQTRDEHGHFADRYDPPPGEAVRLVTRGKKRCCAWGCNRKRRARGLCMRHYRAICRAMVTT